MSRLRAGLERFPRNVRLLTSAAVLEGRRRNLDAARALFSRAHLLEPGNAVLLRVRALNCSPSPAPVVCRPCDVT
jgi:hypothetical protein